MNGNVSIHDDIITVGDKLPRLRSASPLDDRKVRVTFDDGETKIVDLAPALESKRVYLPLRTDDELFRSLHVSEYRNSIEWNDDLDFSAMWLKRLPSVEFSNVDFRNAMEELGMTLDGMAAALEVSRRLIAEYRKDKPIPRHIGLATRYLVEHQAA
ncbi:DUF2442 domain-containing protein [Brucella pseudogrignonensis]